MVNGGKMGFAMELILTPIIHRMIEEEQAQLIASRFNNRLYNGPIW